MDSVYKDEVEFRFLSNEVGQSMYRKVIYPLEPHSEPKPFYLS